MDIKLFDERYVYLEWNDDLEGKDCIIAKSYKDLKDFVNSGDEGRIFKIDKGNEKPFTNHWKECDFCYFDPNYKVKKAWLEGETIQKLVLNGWVDDIDTSRTSLFFYNIRWDAYEWRIKPTEENEKCTAPCDNKYVLNMHKNGYFEFSISKYDVSHPIYFGDKEKCTHVMNTVKNFVCNNEECAECCGLFCHECKELKKFINNITFTRRMTNRELAEYLAKGNGEMKTIYFSPNDFKCIYTVKTSYDYAEGTENEEIGNHIRIRDFGSDEWREPLVEV